MFSVISQFNTLYFPWLLPEDDKPRVELTCESYEECVNYVKQFGNPAFSYSIEEQQ